MEVKFRKNVVDNQRAQGCVCEYEEIRDEKECSYCNGGGCTRCTSLIRKPNLKCPLHKS
jgi:hypothetical protein